jgi:hypothetical protein
MRLDAASNFASDDWRAVTPTLVVENKAGWQRIELPNPVDTQYVRVVCLSNQISRFLEGSNAPDLDSGSVGFFSVKFE